ncbi:hypothetical protein [Sphingobium sp. WCS2017Hpa-17]|uniref:hypothetical protein n=1 Tax=Sphingobium sp. WCS2017Hpa-17 TaxID=3073638 RepID=UPI002889F0B1|nr:hypothetical protein [Sphingobium sp. WCS2017Hpa-17]
MRTPVGICLAALLAIATAATAVAKKPALLPVWPRGAAAASPISLSDFIAEAIPNGDRMAWDHLQGPNVRWVTEGIDYEHGNPSRSGYARLRANGVTSKVLRQTWEELAWSIELSTEGNSKWGPTLLTIEPGFTNDEFMGKYICLGEGFSGCSFGVQSLSGPKLKLTQECSIGNGANKSVAMRAVTFDGRVGTVVYRGSGGSGGISNSVEVTTMTPAQYCAANKERGY